MAGYTGEQVGRQLGRYRLIRLLGIGGSAEVYLGEHTHIGNQAAIKVLRARLGNDDAQQFLEEARTIARLIHPNIVRVLDCDVEQGIPFIIMDYAPCGTLRHLHAKGQPLPLQTIISYTSQVASALQYAHNVKIIHRDVKPGNILVGRDKVLWLSDFGIATVAHSSLSQSVQDISGTLAYIAPEQLQGHPQTASDQYALAVMVYEWLCGSLPFEGTATELAAQHAHVPPPPLREKCSTITSYVEEVVLTALAKDYKARFASVEDFAIALETACQRPVSCPSNKQSSSSIEQTNTNSTVSVPSTTQENFTTLPVQVPRASSLPLTSNILHIPLNRRTFMVGATGLLLFAGASAYLTWLYDLNSSTSRKFPNSTVAHSATAQQQLTSGPMGTLLFKYTGHTRAVNWVAWSPNGVRIASASADDTVQIWNALDGSNVLTYNKHTQTVFVGAWSPNGTMIASGSIDHTVRVWNASDGSDVYVYHGHKDTVGHLAWSPNGMRIASSSDDQTVQVWNATDGSNRTVYRGHVGSGVLGVAWSHDGKYVSSGGLDSTVHVWNPNNESDINIYRGHKEAVFAVPWHPTQYRIASGGIDSRVRVWNAIDSSNEIVYTGHTNWVFSVSWSSNGTHIASASLDKTVQLWNALDGSNRFTYDGHSGSVNAVAWSPNSQYIASGGGGRGDTSVQIWVAG